MPSLEEELQSFLSQYTAEEINAAISHYKEKAVLHFNGRRGPDIVPEFGDYSDSKIKLDPAISKMYQPAVEYSNLHELLTEIITKLKAPSSPIGTIISVLGTTAPDGYLVCDGSIYNIDDYLTLALYFEEQFGTKDKFGGDGITTFAVPDLRGEFLRGSGRHGTNGLIGAGPNPGSHQQPTLAPAIWHENSTLYTASDQTRDDLANKVLQINADVYVSPEMLAGTARRQMVWSVTNNANQDKSWGAYYTSRPTNTGVLYCIAAR